MKTPVEQAPAPLVSDEQIIETSERIYPIPSGLDPEDEEESDMIERIKGDQLLVRRGMREARIVYESELTKMRAERDELVWALRKAVADYVWSEGCSCCQKVKPHEKAEARLAELLKPDAYEDGSGWDWYKYKTE